MKLTVCYFASMRDLAACDRETIDSDATTPAELYRELRTRHPFPHRQSELAVAIDDEITPWETPLSAEAEVSLLPPVSGG